MRVRVLLFASLRERAGVGELALELPAGATVSVARRVLAGQLPQLDRQLERIAWAINRSYATANSPLQEGDELALIPPVSGGCDARSMETGLS